MVMNDPRRPYHKTWPRWEYDRIYDGHNWKYLNLPMEEIAVPAIAFPGRTVIRCILSYDVGKQLDRKRGYLALVTISTMKPLQHLIPNEQGWTASLLSIVQFYPYHDADSCDLDANGKPVSGRWRTVGVLTMVLDWLLHHDQRLVQ